MAESALKRHESFNLTNNIGYGILAGAQQQNNEEHCYDEVGSRHQAAVYRGPMQSESHSMYDIVL